MKISHANRRHIFIYLRLGLCMCIMVQHIRYIWLFSILIKLSGDVKENPSSKLKPFQNFSICQWNVNIVSDHYFSKLCILRAYISIHKFYVICSSETFLNSDTAFDDHNLKIEEYNIAKSDQPSKSS